MRVSTFGNKIKIGDLTASGLFVEAVAGEAITALDVCYIKASDGLVYQLNTGISEVDTCITLMALEAISSGQTGRLLLRGTIEYSSWSLTAGNRIIVPESDGGIAEEAES